MTTPPVAVDSETYLIKNGEQAPKIVCLQYDDGDEAHLLVGPEIPIYLAELLVNSDATIIGQNMAYDMTVFAANYPELFPLIFDAYDAGRVHCTVIRQRLLDLAMGRPKSKYSLDELAKRNGGIQAKVDKNDPWRTRYSELDGVPLSQWPEEAIGYAITDPIATRQVWVAQETRAMEIEYEGFTPEVARQTGFDFALRLMTCWGMRTHPERVKRLLQKTNERLDEIVPLLQAEHIISPKGSKCMAVIRDRIQQAYERDGASAPMTPKGAIKTDKKTIEACDDEALQMVVEHAYLTKLKSTYVLKLIEGTHSNIHASFHTLGADTGRTSSSGPNLQNQSRKGGVRECFVPRDGFDFVSADYDAQELRTLAQACIDLIGYSELAQRFKADPTFDPHTDFAATLMGWSYEEAMARKAAGDEEVKTKRQEAKAANFGFPGGLGAKNFRAYARGYGVKIDLERATELRNRWFEQWPEMKEYFQRVKWVAEGGNLIQLRSKRIRGGVGFTDGANSYFQGLASEASKTAAYLVSKACYSQPKSPLYGCRPVTLIHDELMLEAPCSYSHEAAKELQKLMVIAMKMWCPDVPACATPVVSRCWSKDAEPVYENGRLVPWNIAA